MKPRCFLLPATLPFFLLAYLSSCGEGHDDAHADGHADAHDEAKGESVLDLLEHGDGQEPDPHALHDDQGTDSSAHGPTDEGPSPGTSDEMSSDLHDLLHETPSVPVEVTPGAATDSLEDQLAPDVETPASISSSEAEQALLAMENSQRDLKTQIDFLKKTIAERDGKIATLSRFNEQLRSENSRLRRTGPSGTPDAPLSADIQSLQSQITALKNSLALHQKDNLSLREHNKALLEKIGGARPPTTLNGANGDLGPPDASPPPVVAPSDRSAKLPPLRVRNTPEPTPTPNATPATGSLAFNAVVTASNGKVKEAFYTEFFIADKSLQQILEAGGILLDKDKYPGVSSHAELWARCRKDPFRFANLQKQIRETLLNHVESNGGRRIRTDIDGRSEEIKEVVAERHYVIGTATLGKVGVTWDVPVSITSGKHTNLSLTLANASWSL